MKNKPKEPPQIAIKFANMVFVLGILFSILLIVYAIDKIYNPPEPVSPVFYIISMLCGGVFVTLFGFGLKRLSNNLKVNLSVLFFTIGIAVYGYETYLEFFKKNQIGIIAKNLEFFKKNQIEIISKKMGIPYDKRTKMEVIDDLRDSGVDAYPSVALEYLIGSNGLTSNKGGIFPLSGISNKTTVYCNESGFWSISETDEYGFNNSKGLYKENKVDIVLTGDSFTEGRCVQSANSISAVLRKLDFSAISFGKGGNGPLIELAVLKEYAVPLKPKIVLWLYYKNDIENVVGEMESSILRKYLNEDDYSQNLISRQEEIDSVFINYVQVEWEKQKNKDKDKEREWVKEKGRLINILKLSQLRRMINLKPTQTSTLIFRDILQKSKQMVSDWGGKMYFVYLPAFKRYSTGNEHPNRDFVMQTATELDIPIIDIHSKVFSPHPDPLSLFPFRMSGHYNAEGYRLVAETIGKRLEADGLCSNKIKEIRVYYVKTFNSLELSENFSE